jgi:hypothetical protein
MFVAAWLAACTSATEAPAPTPTPTLAPPKVEVATATVAPTATAIAPTPPPNTATPAATATPAVLNPLTGQPLSDASILERRPLAIKVAHFPRSVREHQVGLSLADNVWEHYAEGGVIRFTGIFYSQTPEKVGNVRSARLIDGIIADAYQALLVASGSSTGTMSRLRENEDLYPRIIAEYTGYSECPLLCREADAALTTNKLFTSPAALWQLAEEKQFGPPQNLTGYPFEASTPASGTPITTIHLDWQLNNTVAEWRYDAASGQYTRWVDTANLPTLAPHVDTLTGQQLSASNIVWLVAPYVPSNIREEEGGQFFFSYDVQLTGEGEARVFRDGVMIEGKWQRSEAAHSLPQFVDAGGNVIPLKPGGTWFAVYSLNSPVKIDAAQSIFQARFRAPDPRPAVTPTP